MTVVTRVQPDSREWEDLLFAWRIVRHVSSNAIVVARDGATLGIGAGQMSRVDSVRIAVEKTPADRRAGAVLASDAFFPFPDGPQLALDAGLTGLIQPGGAKRDDEVTAAVDAAGVTMIHVGRRHFRH
jgi:phosphoribosylaminoimidazolecarboxamide formyltransferase/IMP cyclohydrolase